MFLDFYLATNSIEEWNWMEFSLKKSAQKEKKNQNFRTSCITNENLFNEVFQKLCKFNFWNS